MLAMKIGDSLFDPTQHFFSRTHALQGEELGHDALMAGEEFFSQTSNIYKKIRLLRLIVTQGR